MYRCVTLMILKYIRFYIRASHLYHLEKYREITNSCTCTCVCVCTYKYRWSIVLKICHWDVLKQENSIYRTKALFDRGQNILYFRRGKSSLPQRKTGTRSQPMSRYRKCYWYHRINMHSARIFSQESCNFIVSLL